MGKRLLVAASVLVGALLVVEVVAWTAFPVKRWRPYETYLVVDGRDELVTKNRALKLPKDENGVRAFRPGIEFKLCYDRSFGAGRPYMDERGCVAARINADGLRGPRIPLEAPSDSFRLVAVGDSFTFGHGVPLADTWLHVLEMLGADSPGPDIEGVNLGVVGFDMRDVLHFLRTRALAYAPDLVLYGFFLNDVFVLPDGNAERRAAQEEYERLLYGDPAGLARISQLARRITLTRARRLFEGKVLYEEAFAPDSPHWEACRELLLQMKAATDEAGTEFTVVLFPELVRLEEYPHAAIHRRVEAFCDANGIAFFDLLGAVRGRSAAELWVHPGDHHPNEIAHALFAEALLAGLPQLKRF